MLTVKPGALGPHHVPLCTSVLNMNLPARAIFTVHLHGCYSGSSKASCCHGFFICRLRNIWIQHRCLLECRLLHSPKLCDCSLKPPNMILHCHKSQFSCSASSGNVIHLGTCHFLAGSQYLQLEVLLQYLQVALVLQAGISAVPGLRLKCYPTCLPR